MAKLETLLSFSAPCLVHLAERDIYKRITENNLSSFVLKDLCNSKNSKKYHKARWELIKQGQLICMYGKDVQLFSLAKLKQRYGDNELVCLTYNTSKLPFIKKYPEVFYRDEWKKHWIEYYNIWLEDYSSKIIEHISL